jgi:CheY-like chemotaxis protein
VAEDNPVLQKVTLSMLSPVADCVIVPDGEDVLEKLGESTAYALILMDLQMPRLDGVETTKAVRAIPQCDHIPIVGFTASSIQSELETCKAAGMIEVLSKNLPRAQLQSFVSRYTQPAPQSDAVSEPCAAH